MSDPTPTPKPRATEAEKEDRIHFAVRLRLQDVSPQVVLFQLVEKFGISARHARRYLALANSRLHEKVSEDDDGPPEPILDPSRDPWNDAAKTALYRLQLSILEADSGQLPRLITSLAKLREVMASAPSLSDSDLMNHAAYAGGKAAALGAKSGPEPWELHS